MGSGQSCKISGVAKELWCFIADNIIGKETGKVIWKVGPYYDDTAERELGWIIGQHHAHMIPKGLPGEGKILVYDNGGWAGYGAPKPGSPTGTKNTLRDFSGVIEFDPAPLEDHMADDPTGSWVCPPHRQQPVLQPFYQFSTASSQRKHLDHRGQRRPDLRSHAGP